MCWLLYGTHLLCFIFSSPAAVAAWASHWLLLRLCHFSSRLLYRADIQLWLCIQRLPNSLSSSLFQLQAREAVSKAAPPYLLFVGGQTNDYRMRVPPPLDSPASPCCLCQRARALQNQRRRCSALVTGKPGGAARAWSPARAACPRNLARSFPVRKATSHASCCQICFAARLWRQRRR